MAVDGNDTLTEALASLRVSPPRGLVDRVVSRWVEVDADGTPLYVAFTDRGISFLTTAQSVGGTVDGFVEAHRRRFNRPTRPAPRPPTGLATALRTGTSTGLTFDLRGITPFEQDVLMATAGIPRGETRPYNWVAREIGRPAAIRAVGTALGHNPVPILIPCHRVTRADGSPGNYAFGPAMKLSLLLRERVDLDAVSAMARTGHFYLGSTTTKIFCLPTCCDARRIRTENRQGFRAAVDALEAGFRPCRRCRPTVVPAPTSTGPTSS